MNFENTQAGALHRARRPIRRDFAGDVENNCTEREEQPVSRDRQNGTSNGTDADDVETNETKRTSISIRYCKVDELAEQNENRTEKEKPKSRDPVEVRLS